MQTRTNATKVPGETILGIQVARHRRRRPIGRIQRRLKDVVVAAAAAPPSPLINTPPALRTGVPCAAAAGPATVPVGGRARRGRRCGAPLFTTVPWLPAADATVFRDPGRFPAETLLGMLAVSSRVECTQ